MNTIRLTFIAVFFGVGISFTQTFGVSGKVVNTINEIIPFANILLLNSVDSTFVQGTSADEKGLFLIKEVPPGIYLLQASYIGRGSIPLALDIKSDIRLGALVIPTETQDLDEVVVTAQRPKLQRFTDKLVFQVENTVVSQGSTWDILKNSPGLTVTQDQLNIRGRAANIYLNGRRVQLTQEDTKNFLESLSGVTIKSVEMYTNAPANFDAEDGAVINIITNKNVALGYKGSVEGSYTQAIFPKYSIGTSHYFKSKKINLFANYSYNDKKTNMEVDQGIDFMDSTTTVFSSWRNKNNQVRNKNPHSINLSMDYDFDEKNTLNITSNSLLVPNQDWSRNIYAEIRNDQKQLDSTFTTKNLGIKDEYNLAFDAFYVHKLEKPNAQISLNGHYTNYNDEYTQQIKSDYFSNTGEFLRDFSLTTNADQNIQIFTGQLDYQTPIGTSSLETGIKISRVDSESSIDFYNIAGGGETVESLPSDDFLYDETVYAAYASVVKDWEKWSLKLGLRGELTNAKGVSLTLDETNTQDFFEPFPTLYVLYSLNEDHSFSFDYGRNVQRPKYNDLNPFRYFFNENNFREGNPRLRPNFTNNFNLNYTLNSEFFVDIYYRDNGSYISPLAFQDNDKLTLKELRQNVLGSNSFGLDLTLSKRIFNPWSLYAYFSAFYEDETFIAVESGNVEFKNSIDGFYFFLANYLTLSSDGTFTGELTFHHMNTYIAGSYIFSPQTNLTVGLRKSLWNGRAVVSVAAEDLLGKANSIYTSQYLNQDNFYFSLPETQFVRFGFTYNFGNFRLEENNRQINKTERERL